MHRQTARTGGGRENYELDLMMYAPINPKVPISVHFIFRVDTLAGPQKSQWTLGVRGFDIVVEKAKFGGWPRVPPTLPQIRIRRPASG